ncbi:MAG: MFS transporter [Thermoleophilia bacterium]|nr:MFS transporter [Thermoleophilia bacterium]
MSRLSLYLGQLLSGMVAMTLGPVLNTVLDDLDIPLAKGGTPALTYFFATMIGILSLNFIMARVPVKWCLCGCAIVEAVGLTATALLAHGLWSFAGLYFIVGVPCWVLAGIPGMWISAHVREKTAWALNIVMLASVTGMTVTPLILGVLLDHGAGWRAIFLGEAGISLVFAAVLAAVPLADIPGRENLRVRQLRALAGFRPKLLGGLAVASFLYMGAEMALTTWLPKFQVDVFESAEVWAGLSVTFYFVGQVVGRIVSIPLTRRFLPSTLLLGCCLALGIFTAAAAVAPSQSLSMAMVFFAGFGAASTFSLLGSYSAKFPLWYAGVVYSAYQVAGGVGSMALPYVIGPLADGVSFRVAIAFCALPFLILAGMALFFRKVSGETHPSRPAEG